MEETIYPSSLLSKLSKDSSSVFETLSSSPASVAVPLSRDLASRKLQAATPAAIDTLTDVMRVGSDKDKVAAASKILSISPAVDQPQANQVPSLPAEALSSIISALSSFASALSAFPRPALETVPAPEATAHYVRPESATTSDPVLTPKKHRKTKGAVDV